MASKKRAKKKRGKKKTGRSRKKRSAPATPSLEARLARLERFVATLATTPAKAALAPTAFAAGAGGSAHASALVDVEFVKSDTSPDLVRITLDDTGEEVLGAGAVHGVIAGASFESFLGILVEVTGNPGATATIAVKRAITGEISDPHAIIVQIPLNAGQITASRSLFVTG